MTSTAEDKCETELLNSNLSTITNELDSLLLGNELYENVSLKPGTSFGYAVDIGTDALMYWHQYQQEQQMQEATTIFDPAIATACNNSRGHLHDTRDYSTVPVSTPNLSFPTYGHSNTVAVNLTNVTNTANAMATPPKYEFHYLRSQSFNKSVPNAEPVPLIATATAGYALEHQQRPQRCGQGAYKKYCNYQYNKYNPKQQKAQYLREEVEDDKFEIDLEKIGIPADGIERNPILRLFFRFRKLNHYLHDKFPYGVLVADEPITIRPIPYTMNVQYQVKYAARNCTIFICDLERIMNANKLYDRQIYEECENSVQELRKILGQFELYKRMELEHKRGQFVSEEARLHAECLELLIKQLCDKIRECHLRVHVFNWAVEMKFKTQDVITDSANCSSSTTVDIQNIQTPTLVKKQDDRKDDEIDNNNTPGNRRVAIMKPVLYIGSH